MDGTVRLWDLVAGRASAVLTNHKKAVRALPRTPSPMRALPRPLPPFIILPLPYPYPYPYP